MDKNTFSSYGAIICVVLVIAIMIGMATPFGSFITSGVKENLTKFESLADLDLYKDVVDDENGSGGGETGGDEGGSGELPGGGAGGSEQPDEPTSTAAGLYRTGSNYTELVTPWEDLLEAGTIHVENGVVYTDYSYNKWSFYNGGTNASSSALAGDLALPDDGSVTALGDIVYEYSDSAYDYVYSGDAAFAGCANLTGIKIPDSVTNISIGAFQDCTSLVSITIPDGITEIDEYVCNGCTSLATVELPNSITSIDDTAFNGCTSLPRESGVTYIDTIAYAFDDTVASVVLKEGTTRIAAKAFRDCVNLESVIIPESVTTIGDSAFDHSTISSITIPGTVTDIGHWTFNECRSLKTVNYQGTLEQWCSINFGGHASNPCEEGVSLYINETLATDIVIPDTITTIKKHAFDGCESITSVIIPDSVTSIEEYAFWVCSGLTSITFEGTWEQWSAIALADTAFSSVGTTKVYCAGDGVSVSLN